MYEVEQGGREQYEAWQEATGIARLQALALLARNKQREALTPEDRSYWQGMQDGLLRAVTVVEGRG